MMDLNNSKFNFMTKGSRIILVMILIVISTIYTSNSIYENKLEATKTVYQDKINKLEEESDFYSKDVEVYKSLNEKSERDCNTYKTSYEQVSEELDTLKEQIVLSKTQETERISRGGVSSMALTEYAIMTVNEMNEWIKNNAPADSPFIGNGKLFLEASQASGLSPKYLVAHAALESTWGTSDIAVCKNNYFGITAYNGDAFNSAKSFASMEDGIIAGALWIKENFIDKGRDSLQSMLYEGKAYAQNDDGSPNENWLDQISSIIKSY